MMFLSFLILSMKAQAAVPPAPFPLFLRQGFSCVLEFEGVPKKVVVGDLQSFQVERMDKSLVVRSLTDAATSNLFVYFESGAPHLFLLTASEEAEPTLYRKFESQKTLSAQVERPKQLIRKRTEEIRILSAKFDSKKDYLTLDVEVSAGTGSSIQPFWNLVRIKTGNSTIAPVKTWAERKEIQKDSAVKARFVFARPNIPRDLRGVSLVVPLTGRNIPFSLNLGGK